MDDCKCGRCGRPCRKFCCSIYHTCLSSDCQLIEFAVYIHQSQSRLIQHLMNGCTVNDDGSVLIPAELVERWKRQSSINYHNLTTDEQAPIITEARSIQMIARGPNRKL